MPQGGRLILLIVLYGVCARTIALPTRASLVTSAILLALQSVTQLGLQGPTDQRTLNGVSAQPTARVLHAELESTAATDDAPVEDASHQQALQHGKGGTEQHKLQRQLGQRFRDLPDALTLLLPANGSPESAQPAANATAMTDAPAKLKTDITPGVVLVLTLFMAAASALGATPYFFVHRFNKEYSALASAVACGVMLAASFDLVHEGQPYGANLVILGVLVGAVFIQIMQQQLDKFGDVKFESLTGANARKTVLVIGIMAAHAVGEGCGVGVSFCGSRGWAQGILVTLAIGLHNVPEGLAVATVLVSRGVPARKAAWWALATALPQPLLAVPSFMFVDTFTSLLPLALGFAAGCMTWMVFAELIPDALADAPHGKVATTATFSACGLEALRMLLADLEQPGGTLINPVKAPMHLLLPIALKLVPTVLPAGAVGALLAQYSSKPRAGLVGLAAGIMLVLASAALVNQIAWDSSITTTSSLAYMCIGGIGVWLFWRQQAQSLSKAAKDVKKPSSPDVESQADNRALDKTKHSGEGFGILSARTSSWNMDSTEDRPNAYTNGLETPPKHQQGSVLSWAYPQASSHRPESNSKTRQPARHGIAAAYASNPASPGTRTLGAGLAILALALHSICEGWTAALAIVGDMDAATMALPLFLTGALKAAAVSILAALVYKQTTSRAVLAGSCIAVLTPVAALLRLARVPLGSLPPQFVLDAPGVTGKLTAATAGAMLVLGVQVLTPIAVKLHGQASMKGLFSGVTCGVVVLGLRGGLCMVSSYCIHAR